jgi:hypothetical protein
MHLFYLVLKLSSVPVPAQRRYALKCDCVPDLYRAVVTAAGKLRTVGTEAHTTDKVRVPAQRRYALTGDWVPDHDSAVVTAAGKLRTVGAETDTTDNVQVPAQRQRRLASRPNFDAVVLAGTSNLIAVWAPCHRPDPAFAMR